MPSLELQGELVNLCQRAPTLLWCLMVASITSPDSQGIKITLVKSAAYSPKNANARESVSFGK